MHFDESKWREEFSRLAEMADATNSEPPESFFRRVPHSITSSHLAFDVYRDLESELAELDKTAWGVFKAKALGCPRLPRGHYGYRDIHTILNEAKGYRYLKETLVATGVEFDHIEPVPEGDNKSPDWRAMANTVAVGLTEVKTVCESDDQSEYIFENTRLILKGGPAKCRRASSTIPEALLRKLACTVKTARQQLHACDAGLPIPRIAYLIVYLDHALGETEEDRQALATCLDDFNEGTFHVAYEFHCT